VEEDLDIGWNAHAQFAAGRGAKGSTILKKKKGLASLEWGKISIREERREVMTPWV